MNNRLKISVRSNSSLAWLIYINIALFVLVGIYNAIFFLATDHTPLFFDKVLALSSEPYLFAKHPWTLVTYMFYHVDIIHILFNLLFLYWFGIIFYEFFGSIKLISVYVAGGVAGGLFYLLAYNTLPVFYDEGAAILLGASASIMALTFGVAAFTPNHSIWLFLFGEIKLKYLALIYLVLDLIQIPFGNAGGHLAHLGGAILGASWGYAYRKNGINILGWLEQLFSFIQHLSLPRKRIKVAYKNPKQQPIKKQNSKELDFILDKISQKGFDSLTNEEKEKLFRYKNELDN